LKKSRPSGRLFVVVGQRQVPVGEVMCTPAKRSRRVCRRLLLLMQRLRSQFDPETSHAIERLAAGAWPAEEVEEVEGWLLRRTDGVPRRRSNSLLPPADPVAALESVELALTTAEELDFAQVVQVSPAEGHLRLDEALEARGMAHGGSTLVLAGPLKGTETPAADIVISVEPGAPEPGPVASPPAVGVRVAELSGAWIEAWAAVDGQEGTQQTGELVLSQLGARGGFAAAVDARTDEPLGTCIGVAEDGWLGLFSLAVSPAARRRGIATQLVDALEDWASTIRGAERVYLQVEADNDVALAFYAARGFHIAHSYHYRSA
jgi:GNAT superfamily N-acetyltransferase